MQSLLPIISLIVSNSGAAVGLLDLFLLVNEVLFLWLFIDAELVFALVPAVASGSPYRNRDKGSRNSKRSRFNRKASFAFDMSTIQPVEDQATRVLNK